MKKNLPSQPKADEVIPEINQHSVNEVNLPSNSSSSDVSELAKIIQEKLNFNFMPFKPRGLTNKSSFCFINSTLQSLLVCSPIHRALRKIGSFPPLQQTINNDIQTPAITGMAAFVSHFETLERHEYERTFGKLLKAGKEVRFNDSFEPQPIYDMLSVLRPSMAKGERQEDAEEFLGCLLDNLHEEMVSISSEKLSTNTQVSCEEDKDDTNSSDGEWQQALSKKKSAVTRTVISYNYIVTFFGSYSINIDFVIY